MANTFVKIATVNGTGSSATLQFTSIPATYTDLVLKLSLSNTSTGGYFELRFNGATTNLSGRYIQGDGSAVDSSTFQPWGRVNNTAQTANTFASTDVYIPNYAGSNNKSLSLDTVSENNGTAASAILEAGLWSSSAAITSIEIVAQTTGNFTTLSTATLYGISNS